MKFDPTSSLKGDHCIVADDLSLFGLCLVIYNWPLFWSPRLFVAANPLFEEATTTDVIFLSLCALSRGVFWRGWRYQYICYQVDGIVFVCDEGGHSRIPQCIVQGRWAQA